ncbi:protein kinase [Candidatus Sumerlaeota bacterium]|nr:protein kinase [Candidatus Sumerlaeota bacterium]
MRIEPRTTLDGRFRIIQEIGSGAFSDVFLAEDCVRSENLALKVTQVATDASDRVANMVMHESALYRKVVDFHHVLRVYDVHLARYGGGFLVLLSMEYAEGGNFRQWLNAHREDLETRRSEGMRLFKQICDGVNAIHESGVVHLDIKPENALFVAKIIKVSDLGAARFLCGRESLSDGESSLFWSHSGTAVYAAPECFSASYADEIDPRADIYSLGILGWEILHPKCRPPFQGDYDRLRELHLHVPAAALPHHDLPEWRVILRCLEKDPAQRYQCVEALLTDLENCRDATGQDSSKPKEGEVEPQSGTNDMLDRVHAFMAEKDFPQAKRLCLQVLKQEPDQAEARAILDKVEMLYNQAAEYYKRAEYESGRGDLNDLAALLNEAASIYPNHPAGMMIQTAVLVRARRYQEAMEKGWRYLREGNWEFALSHLDQAKQLHPGAVGAAQAAETLARAIQKRNSMRERTEALAEAGRWDEAERVARLADHFVSEINGLWDRERDDAK